MQGLYGRNDRRSFAIEAESIGWQPVGEGAYLHIGDPDALVIDVVGVVLEDDALRKWGILTASRTASIKHTDWAHEGEIRILAPKAGTLPVLGEVLKRVHYIRTDGEHWGAIMQLLRAYYPTVEITHWQFSHGELSAIPTPMEFRLIPV